MGTASVPSPGSPIRDASPELAVSKRETPGDAHEAYSQNSPHGDVSAEEQAYLKEEERDAIWATTTEDGGYTA